jgi:hypothetical protein
MASSRQGNAASTLATAPPKMQNWERGAPRPATAGSHRIDALAADRLAFDRAYAAARLEIAASPPEQEVGTKFPTIF